MCLAESHADPEVYPRPDGSVYICGEAESVDLPDDPADIKPRVTSTASLRVSHTFPPLHSQALNHFVAVLLY